MRIFDLAATIAVAGLALAVEGCSDQHATPSGPVSTANSGKAAFNEAKAIEKIYRAGFTRISLTRRDPDGVWRGRAVRKGAENEVDVLVTKDGPVRTR